MKKLLWLPVALVFLLVAYAWPALAADPTTSVHVVKYAADGSVVAETTRTYEWLRDNLPVHGDGVTHYYLQGPVFEGDMWDPAETENLKDKGAVEGTALRDICDLVGGMSPGDEVRVKAVDGWHADFAYENIYQPRDIQGVIALCWYSGGDALEGERYGQGYPDKSGYSTAMQIVFLAGTTNSEGKYVFGNTDMKICLPDEKYQHFYEGLPSTNGLSGKWISEVDIFSGEPPAALEETTPAFPAAPDKGWPPLVLIIIGAAGIIIIAGSLAFLLKKR
jgi:hypothetical protein